MAVGNSFWDDFLQNQQSGWSPSAGSSGSKGPGITVSGNSAWQQAQAGKSNFPAVNQMANPKNTAFARNAPVNTIAQNLNQIPIGGYGLGALQNAGYSRSPQMNFGNFLNQGATNQQPTMTGYRWNAGTGGVSGGNNDTLRQNYSDGTTKTFTGGVQDNATLSPTRYTLPGVNAPNNALGDPSVGALEGSTRYSEMGGKRQVVNTPSGGQIIAGASLRKPQKMTPGDTWSLGGWY